MTTPTPPDAANQQMSANGPTQPWTPHDSVPAPTGPREPRATRRPMSFWDRTKILVLLVGAFGVMVWSVVASNPTISTDVVLTFSFRSYGWLLALAGLEAI